MHVVSVAVDNLIFESSGYESALADATPEMEENLRQVVAVGGLCNAAVFGLDKGDESERAITGDATGENRKSAKFPSISPTVVPDAAILRFSNRVLPADPLRSQWREIFKVNFNSKVRDNHATARLS